MAQSSQEPDKNELTFTTFLQALENLPAFAQKDIDIVSAKDEMLATRETIRPQRYPRLYQLETTSKCNLACPFCPRTTQLVAKHQRDMNVDMPLDQFEAVLDKMPWLKSLELFHFGEPFMMKNIHDYIAACKERGIYVVIASNLLPATPLKIDKAFAAGLDFLVMDVDSLNAERYASMRVNGDLGKLHKAVTYILSKPRNQRPYCVAQTIMLDGKPEYTEQEFVEWTGGLKAEEVRYKFLDSFRETVVQKEGLGPEDLCRESFYGFTVHVNGNVVPCDRDWAGENVMGNIFEQDALEIWNGEKFNEFRARMKSTDKPEMCKRCTEGKLVNLRSQPHIQVNMFKGEEVYYK
jgi:radical SAM protein with 4Fe4S-binding SPASM domain